MTPDPLPISLLFPPHSIHLGRKSQRETSVCVQGFIPCGFGHNLGTIWGLYPSLQQLGRGELPSWSPFPQGIPRAPSLL